MEIVDNSWKSNLITQLRHNNGQHNRFEPLIEYNHRLLNANSNLHNENLRFNVENENLRFSNERLRSFEADSIALAVTKNKNGELRDEVIELLKRNSDLTNEILRLNLALEQSKIKVSTQAIKLKEYEIEIQDLRQTLEETKLHLSKKTEQNNLFDEELSQLKMNMNVLQAEHQEIHPQYLKCKQELETARQTIDHLEKKLIEKNQSLSDQFQTMITQHESRISIRSNRESFLIPDEDDLVFIERPDPCEISPSLDFENGNKARRKNIPQLLKKIFNPDNSSTRRKSLIGENFERDDLKRSPAICVAAVLPTRSVAEWNVSDAEIYSLAFHPSGSLLAVGSSDNKIELWEISGSAAPSRNGSLSAGSTSITVLDFDGENGNLLAACSDKKVYLWSLANQNQPKEVFCRHTAAIRACRFISGVELCTGGDDKSIRIWDLRTSQQSETLVAESKCHDIAIINGRDSLLTGHYDKRIRLFDRRTRICQAEITMEDVVTSLAFEKKNQQILVGLKNNSLALMDFRQLKTMETLCHDDFRVNNDTNRAILSPDGRYACSGSSDGSLFFWDLTLGRSPAVCLKRHKTFVSSVVWHPAGQYVVSSEKRRHLILWG